MIDLHFVGTSNGLKPKIMLEEIGLPYQTITYEIFAADHLKPEFKHINPNHRLPAIVDHDPVDGGEPFAVFESGAVLTYLAEKSGRFMPASPRGRSLAQQWLTWQVAGLGPMLGQAYHFLRFAPLEQQEYGLTRYKREARRLLHVLDYRLKQEAYLAVEYSIADIACWPWLQNVSAIDLDIAEFPAIHRWSAEIAARPAVIAALRKDESAKSPVAFDRLQLTEEQWSNLFGDNLVAAAKGA